MSVFRELVTNERGNRFARCVVPAKFEGKTFLDLMVHLKKTHDALLVAVNDGKNVVLNPTDHVFRGGEDVVLIATRPVEL